MNQGEEEEVRKERGGRDEKGERERERHLKIYS